jgi:hypothetical protein
VPLPRPRHPLLDHPPFVGRPTEVAQLLSRWDAARAGQGHFVLLEGEAGIGKSRICEEFLAHVRQHGACTALAHCYEHERALPYGPLTDLLRTLIAATPDLLRRLSRWQAVELAYLLPECGDRTGRARDATRRRETTPDPQHQARLFDAVNFLLLELAQRRPLLLILEDLHWASESTLAWLHSLARRLDRAPLLLVGSCRCEESPPDHALHSLYANLARAGLATRLELPRLTPAALTSWFAEGISDFTARLHRQTEGHPFFALETLRALHDAGLAEVTPDRRLKIHSTGRLPVPQSVRDVIRLRLARLPPAAREGAEVAAVVGRNFDFEILHVAWGRAEEEVLEALDALLRRRLIRESRSTTGADYEFDHHLVQEVLYAGLHYRRKRRWHRAVGSALAALPAQPGHAARIAYHFDAGADPHRALPYYETAAREAQAHSAWQEAEALLERMLVLLEQLQPEGPGFEVHRHRARILSLRAEQRDNLGRLAERDADIAALEALASCGDPPVRLLALVQRTRALTYGGRYHEALCLAETGLALARAQQDRAHELRFLAYMGSAHYFLGQPARALASLEKAQALVDGETSNLLRARLHQFLGYTYFHLTQWSLALQHHELAISCSTALGDHSRAVWNLLDAAYLRLKLGQWAEARRGIEQGLDTARQLSLVAAEGYARLILGEWQLYRGQYAAAGESLREAQPLHQASGGVHNGIATSELLGWVGYHLGDFAGARELLDSAAAEARRIGHRRLLVAALAGLGLVLSAQEAYAAAQEMLEEAVVVARESACVENLLKSLCALARVMRLGGAASHALTYAREALALAQSHPVPTAEMWAALETGLALEALGDAAAAATYTARAAALLPRAHAAWIQPADVRAACARVAVGHSPVC